MNDEVLDVDQDALGKQAVRVPQSQQSQSSDIEIYAKPMEDGSWAVGLFNLGTESKDGILNWQDLGLKGEYTVRDLWRQKNLRVSSDSFTAPVRPHGVLLLRVSSSGIKHH